MPAVTGRLVGYIFEMALRQFGPKTNSDQKPDSDQRQIRTQF